MAGIPPHTDSGAGRGRGMNLPSWMSGSNSANNGVASSSVPPAAPGLGQLGQPFPQSNNQQFRPGMGPPPGMVPGMGTHYPQFAQRPNQTLPSAANIIQQQRPPSGFAQPPSNANAVGAPPSIVGVTSTFQYGSSAPVSQPTFGVPSGPLYTSAPPQLMQNVPSNTQMWLNVSAQQNASAPSPSSQTTQLSTATSTGLTGAAAVAPSPSPSASDWQEHSAPDGRRYYYNKKTKVSSWEKPAELMTPTERADASTVWKEFTAADGRKYYYNKLTKQSKWTMPDEMKVAREKAEIVVTPSPAHNLEGANLAVFPSAMSPSPSLVGVASPAPLNTTSAPLLQPSAVSKPEAEASSARESASPAVTTPPAAISAEMNSQIANVEIKATPDGEGVLDEEGSHDVEKKLISEKSIGPAVEENSVSVDEEQPVFSNKTEAKTVFKELLEVKNVGSDWSWEQAMRAIINDKRYGVLKTSGERKQTFNEYVAQKRKQESEERRLKQKKAREEFVVMLQESKELTSTMRWSKAASLFSEDPRFIAVEKERDRAELFEDYLQDLEKKEREKAREDRKKFLAEYKEFLETCDFIKASTQWRKVVDKLEDDERCSRLEKIDRLEIFMEHIKELEAHEEEEKKIQKEQQRRRERKNRDEFRKLLADHKESGVLTARTTWKNYVLKIKEDPAYEALCTNLTGSTPKDLFEHFLEDLEKKYQEDKMIAKEAIKGAKISVTTTWTFDTFKDSLADAGDLGTVDESNLKIVFEDLLDRAKEKEEKEAKKRKRLIDEFNELLHAEKSITATSTWEDCKILLENAPEFRALPDDSTRQEIFEVYVAVLQQKAREKDKKREEEKAKKEKEREREKEKEREKRKEKERKEKEREKEKEKERERQLRKESQAHPDARENEKERSSRKERESLPDGSEKEKDKAVKKEREILPDMVEVASVQVQKEERRKDKEKDRDRERERERKHRKSHRSRSSDDGSSGKEDREDLKRSRKHSSDKRRSSRKHAYESNSDSETRHKRHKKDRDSHRRVADELEDGELGEDGEIDS